MKIWFLVALSCTIVVLLATAGCTQTFEPQPTPSPAPTTIPARVTNRSADPCCYHPGSRTDSTCPPPFTPDEHQRHALPLHHLRTGWVYRHHYPVGFVRIYQRL